MNDCCCGLGATCLTPNIPGRGASPCKYLIVGANPNAKEDTQGEVFIGPTGRLLESMLADAGIKLEECAFTHAVRCKTPANRPPTPAEIASCRPRLCEEIALFRPQVILAAGDVALRALTGRGALSSVRGQSVPLLPLYKDCAVESCVPVYHPTFVLRVPQVRPTVVTDFVRARRGDEADDVPFQTVHAGCPALLPGSATGDLVSYDIETDYWWTKGNTIIQAAISSSLGTSVIRGDNRGLAALLREHEVVSHNGWAFDDKLSGVTSAHDTMALAYLDDESQPLGLEALCVKYLGVPGWKEARASVDPLSDEFALYNARDAAYTLRLYHTLVARLGGRALLADVILRPAHYALMECSRRGLYIDAAAVAAARSKFSGEVVEHANVILALSRGHVVNPNASRQVAAALLVEGHPLPMTETGLPATGESVLASLHQTPLVRELRAYRKAAKKISGFVVPYERVLQSLDSRVHNEYTTLRTATGRTSARKLNVQQLDRDPLIRAFMSAPPGYELWSVDYSAIEFRIAAWVAQEPGILERYAADPNWDPHQWFANSIGMSRQAAKSANFGLLYRAQAPALQEYARKMGVNLTMGESAAVRNTWHETFPAFNAWYGRVAMELREHGYVQTFTGRRRHFGDPDLLKGFKFMEALREAVNTHVQGPAADIALLGLIECHKAGLPINGFFHDAITFEFPAGEGKKHLEQITHLMTIRPVEILKEKFNVTFDMPLTVEAKQVA